MNNKRVTQCCALCILVVCMVGWAPVARSQQKRTSELAACGPFESKLKVSTSKKPPPSDTGTTEKTAVYVIQTNQQRVIPECRMVTRFGIDGSWVGGNCTDTYFRVELAPGLHHMCGEWQTKMLFQKRPISALSLQLSAGKIYYVRANFALASRAGHNAIDLQIIDEDEGKLLISKEKQSSFELK